MCHFVRVFDVVGSVFDSFGHTQRSSYFRMIQNDPATPLPLRTSQVQETSDPSHELVVTLRKGISCESSVRPSPRQPSPPCVAVLEEP
jgi:hypothetical protein